MARPLRILIAEDDEDDLLLMQRAFDKADLEVASVHYVRNGQEVIDYLERRPPFDEAVRYADPTLLLLDLKMPQLDGFEVLRWLRRQPDLRQMLVVVFTSSEAPRDRRRAFALGADSFVLKPQNVDQFVDTVREMEQYWLRLNATPECGCVRD